MFNVASLKLIVDDVGVDGLGLIPDGERRTYGTQEVEVALAGGMRLQEVRAVRRLLAIRIEEVLKGVKLIICVAVLEVHLWIFLNSLSDILLTKLMMLMGLASSVTSSISRVHVVHFRRQAREVAC